MPLTRIGQDELRRRVSQFLDSVRRAGAEGDFDEVARHYDFPVAMHYPGETRVISGPEDLREHLQRLAEVSREAGPDGTIWTQKVLSADIIGGKFISAIAEVHRIDRNANPVQPQRQGLVLRARGEVLSFASVINPIRSGYWQE